MAINDLGHRAISLTGSQAGIVTDTSHTKARIVDVRADRITAALDEGAIVLVAGFQGVSTAKDVTTLGRGGSDTTAVALAAAVGADVCEICTDVPGVFTADPRVVPGARKLPVISFEEMLEMAASGAGVLQLRSVEYARTHGVRIHCRSSFDERPGTYIVGEEETMEHPLITAVTHSTDEARVTLVGVPDVPGLAGKIFGALADANVNVDMIVQNEPVAVQSQAEISFTVPIDDLNAARATLEPLAGQAFADLQTEPSMGKVSIVGAGMRTHPGVAATVFRTLGEQGINIEMISTSPIKISCVVRADRVQDAVRALHSRLRARRRRDRGRARRSERRRDRLRRPAGRGRRRDRRRRPDDPAPARRPRLPGPRRSSPSPPSARPAASSPACACRRSPRSGIEGFDLALFSAGGAISGEWAPKFVQRGAVVVDNSSTWRMNDDVPLVVAEVNPDAVEEHQGIIANPNCTVMQALLPLKAIHDAVGLERVILTSYQSVSGTGVRAVEELKEQAHAMLHDVEDPRADGLSPPHRLQRGAPGRALQGRRRLHDRGAQGRSPRRARSSTCPSCGSPRRASRVPVLNCHSEALNVETTARSLPGRLPRAAGARPRTSSSRTTPPPASTRWPAT